MTININFKDNTIMANKKQMDAFFELAIKSLIDNHIKSSIKYFKQSIFHGNKRAYTYCNFLRSHEDVILARDIILCAENRI